ncbi:MAG: outer membrane protein assembly factor BamA [Pseudomonadota bacterium]
MRLTHQGAADGPAGSSAGAPRPRGVATVWLRALALAVLGALAWSATTGDARAQVSPGPAVTTPEAAAQVRQGFVVRGNRRIEVDTIIALTEIVPGQTVTPAVVNEAVRKLFASGLFRDVRITPSGGRLVIEVVENPSINVIAFEGNDALSDDVLRQIVSLRPRRPFTPARAEQDAQAIIEVYRRTGRFGAQVEPVLIEREQNRVDVVFEISEGELTGVTSIDFVGNEAFSDRRLRGEIETSESGILSNFISTDLYDPDRLELDRELLRQFYLENGYADFTVLSATAELAPDASGFFITFTVEEGPVYTFGEFDVSVQAEGLEPEDFLALIPDDLTGETYDASEVEEIADAMTELAGQEGFAFVRVRPRPRKNVDELTIDIVFELDEGNRIFIERIDIVGNTSTLDRVIRREMGVIEGDAFDARRIREAQGRIRALGYFSRVDIDASEGSAPDRAILTVQVEERSTGSLSLGLGFSTSAGPIGSVALSERNFLGRGQEVRATVTAAGATQVYDFSFTEPKVLDRDLAVGFRAFFIDDDREEESSFNQVRGGVTPTVSFPLGERTDLSLRYSVRFDDIQVENAASPAIQAEDGSTLTSLVGYTLTYDARNDPIEPTGGYLATWENDIAGLGGDQRFVRGRARVKAWQGLFGDDVILSWELEGGAVFGFANSDVNITERYFLGGDSFRGFAIDGLGPRDVATDDALGGNIFLASRLEVSFPLGLPEELGIFGGVFVDAGTLFQLDNTVFGATVIDDTASLRVAAGGLLFVDTPFGPIELSVGVPLIKEDFDEDEIFRFAIGTRF